jgi:hypothetical protein
VEVVDETNSDVSGLALVVGLLVGTFRSGPLLPPPTSADDKLPQDAGKGKCVGVSSLVVKDFSGKDQVVICRAFEGRTVEIHQKRPDVLPDSWGPPKK